MLLRAVGEAQIDRGVCHDKGEQPVKHGRGRFERKHISGQLPCTPYDDKKRLAHGQ